MIHVSTPRASEANRRSASRSGTQCRNTGPVVLGAFLLTVKRDTQGERTTKSRNSWGSVVLLFLFHVNDIHARRFKRSILVL